MFKDDVGLADAFAGDALPAPRNRALLLCGFDLAFRGGELIAIDVEHLAWRGPGVAVTIPRSKGDPGGQGAGGALLRRPDSPYCPVLALKRWLETIVDHALACPRDVDRWAHTVGHALALLPARRP